MRAWPFAFFSLALSIAVAAAVASQGCGGPASQGGRPPEAAPSTASAAPSEGPGPAVLLPSGLQIRSELARTEEERAQGLMYRAEMPKDAGMVFLFDSEDVRPFWMKNCHFPLDIVHTRSDGTVVDVLENVPPCAADPCPSYPPAAKGDTVLELNAGVARANGVRAGAKLKYLRVPGR